MKKKIILFGTLIMVLSVCATVTLSSFTDTTQRDVSYAALEVHYNADDEVADMNTETTKNVIDEFLGDKVETTKNGGLLGGLGDFGIGGIFQDGKDIISSIIGGAGGSGTGGSGSGSSGTGGSSSGSGGAIYIDPVPAGTQNYSSADASEPVTESDTQVVDSTEPVASSTASAGDMQNFTESETYQLETAPDTIETEVKDEDEEGLNPAVIIAIIAAIWCVVIIVIIILVVMKKKGGKKADADKELEFTYGAKKESKQANQSSDMSLSDLFEEANK